MPIKALEMYFDGEGYSELSATKLTSFGENACRYCVRGKTAGAFLGAGSFQWTHAVRGLCILMLRHYVSARFPRSKIEAILSGTKGSVAASLDYALTKQPLWLLEMFGVDAQGKSIAHRLVRRTNSNMKRPGPVAVVINEHVLPHTSIRIFADGVPIVDQGNLIKLLSDIESSKIGNCRNLITNDRFLITVAA